MQDLPREDKDGLIALYSKMTEAKALFRRADDCDYLTHGSALSVILQIEALQDKLVSVLICGELPIQPVRIPQRNFIGSKS